MHSPEIATVWTNLSALAFFSNFACRAASAPRVAARKSAIARDSVIACPLHGQPFSHREATSGVSQAPSAGLTIVAHSRLGLAWRNPGRALPAERHPLGGQLDHPAADAGVACLGEPFFAPPAAALVGGAGEARIAGDGSSIAPGPGKNLMDQHVRCLYADAHDTGEEMNHDMRLFFRSLLRPLRTGLLNLLDLVHDEPQAGHVATKFEQRVGRERPLLGGPQRCETVRRLAQRGLEGPNPEADQTALHPVDQARALTNEPLALTVGALGILLRQRWNGDHVAVIGFAAQPADEDPFEQSRVEAICFRPAMLGGDSLVGGVDDVGFDMGGREPARQPDPVGARLERGHACSVVAVAVCAREPFALPYTPASAPVRLQLRLLQKYYKGALPRFRVLGVLGPAASDCVVTPATGARPNRFLALMAVRRPALLEADAFTVLS